MKQSYFYLLFTLLFAYIGNQPLSAQNDIDGYPIANFALTVNTSESGDFFGDIMQNPGKLGEWLQSKGSVLFSIEKGGKRHLFSDFSKKTINRKFPFVESTYKGSPLTKVQFSTKAFCPLGINDEKTSALPILMLEINCTNPTKQIQSFSLIASPEGEIQQNMEFTKNDCFSGIKNNLCQISTNISNLTLENDELYIPVHLQPKETQQIRILLAFSNPGWITDVQFQSLDDLSAYAYRLWNILYNKTKSFDHAIPSTEDQELDMFLRWYMIPSISLTKWTDKDEVVTMGYHELNQRDSYWTSWTHLVFYKRLEQKMIEESIAWQQPSGKIPTTILPLIEREDDLDINAFFILRIARFYQFYHCKQELLTYWPAMKKAMDWLISRDSENIGLPMQISFWGDWKDVPGIEGRKYSPFSCLIYLIALKEMMSLSKECNDDAAFLQYQTAYNKGYETINKNVTDGGLWNGSYYCQIWKDGSVNDKILQDQTIGILFNIIPQERALKIIDALNKNNLTPYGIAETYPYYDESFGLEPATYHNGGVWPWVSFMDCWGRINLGRKAEAIDLIKRVGRADIINSGDWSPNEHINSLTGENLGFHIQGWNSALFGLIYFGLQNPNIIY